MWRWLFSYRKGKSHTSCSLHASYPHHACPLYPAYIHTFAYHQTLSLFHTFPCYNAPYPSNLNCSLTSMTNCPLCTDSCSCHISFPFVLPCCTVLTNRYEIFGSMNCSNAEQIVSCCLFGTVICVYCKPNGLSMMNWNVNHSFLTICCSFFYGSYKKLMNYSHYAMAMAFFVALFGCAQGFT